VLWCESRLKGWSTKAVFGAFRVIAIDHRNESVVSKRTKIIQFTYTGAMMAELQRGQAAFQKTKVLPFFRAVHLTLDMPGRDLDALFKEELIAKRLHDSTAAHKPTHYHFLTAGASEIPIEELLKKGRDEDDD
jgi:hypothetical protein